MHSHIFDVQKSLGGQLLKTTDYLKLAKIRLEITSDYALAKKLGMTQTGLSYLMNGKNIMGEETALKLAVILKRDPLELLAVANRERAKTPETAAIWGNLADRIAEGFRSLSLRAKSGRRFAFPR